MQTLLIVFIVVTAVAVVLQMGILLGIFLSLKRTSARFEALASDLHGKITPVLELSRDLLSDLNPKVKIISTNLTETSNVVRTQAEHLNMIVSDVSDRTHAQFIRVDHTISTVLDTVEKTTDTVQHKVMSPVRQVNGIMQAASAIIGTLFSKRRANNNGHDNDDLFI